MYWYYKVPLVIVLGVVLVGCGVLVWKRLPGDLRERVNPQELTSDLGGSGGGESSASPEAGASDPQGPNGESAAPVPRIIADRLRTARSQLDKDNLLGARALAQKVAGDAAVSEFSDPWRAAAAVVSEVNTRLFNSDIPAPQKATYVIQSGDSLARIAKKFNTTIGALQRGNSLDPNSARIYPGDVLRIYRADWSIEVVKEHFSLLLKDGEQLFKLYDVGIGRQNRTPVGTFRVDNKQKEPAWTPPGKIIEYGDPENVLGTRWLGLKPTGDTNPDLRGYGIHGTWAPETIGTAASEGCVRMRNEDVNELFDVVPLGAPVRIRNE